MFGTRSMLEEQTPEHLISAKTPLNNRRIYMLEINILKINNNCNTSVNENN